MIKLKCFLTLMLLFLIFSFDVNASQPKVCFFIDENYQGESLCTTEGNAIDVLPTKWNDSISSIEIPRGMVVSVSKDVYFSGQTLTFKDSVDSLLLLRWANLNDEISSFKVREAACFYEFDQFVGDSFCLSGNESIDLYNDSNLAKQQYHIVNPLNDRISSISIPNDTQVTIYKDDEYTGTNFVLMNYFSIDELEKIGMNKEITSIKVHQQEEFICDQYCVVKGILSIPLGYGFGPYWLDDRIKYKEALISFNFSGDDNYSLDFSNDIIVKVVGRMILFIHKSHKENSFVFELDKRSDTLSFLLRFNGRYSEIQFIESVLTTPIYISPIVGSLFDFGLISLNLRLNNFNKDNLLVINKIVLTAEKKITRIERGVMGTTACWLMPIMSIYNYVIQGKCNQVDRFVNNIHDFFNNNNDKILQISGSAKPYPKIKANDSIEFDAPAVDFSSKVEGALTHINTDMRGEALTMPATALACNVSLKEQLLPHLRYRRDLKSGCVEWTLNILTDFTLLFGGSVTYWNAESFGRVIEHILKEGNTGQGASNSEVERRLVDNVQKHLAENDSDLINIKTAFDFAQLSYADYLQHHDHNTEVYSPLIAQELPMGRYELALQNFQFIETVPRIRREGQWIEDTELHFETEVISGMTDDTLAARQTILPVINEWRRTYYQAKAQSLTATAANESRHQPTTAVMDDRPTTETRIATDDSVIEAACLVSDVAQSWLRTSSDDYIYIVVRLAGQIVSITMAMDINESDTGIAGSLTNPDYVLRPEVEGGIRGAGTAAIRALADHLSKKGKRSLVSDVISKPSAVVKKKVGFKFINEF
ncbi:beta-gamma-crystallin [Yersinia frederiksenii]|uniref:Beta-gamma-crystallin n=2 Tax=Yersinia frederiksenii TaxID=29484 RepID=A0A380PST4_YERFR|nr:exotoxin [Yersinia frederiksenii]ATM94867.1 exotoxin [Yersinia frederiksenii]KGA47436.1 beta/Gamma crystallin family protein [Yersinia frederiksenii ATCC 33641]SUP76591.1 beta-gamma-crystallin [Yersinia frederiksenii]